MTTREREAGEGLSAGGADHIQRRGLVAGAAGLVVGMLSRLASPGRVHANDGGNFILGNNDDTTNDTTLQTRLVKDATNNIPAFAVVAQAGNAIVGEANQSTRVGVAGVATGATGRGVLGAGPSAGVLGAAGGHVIPAASNVGVIGVANNPTAGAVGVHGDGREAGVRGVASTLNAGTGAGIGVHGQSTSGAGVHGESVSGYGAIGVSSAPAGTVVPGFGLAAGGYGRSQFGAGLYGYAFGPPNQPAPTYGFIGQSEGGFGAWGLCSAPPGTIASPGGGSLQAVCGVLGTSASNVGMYAISTGSFALVADANGPGTVGALVRKPGGQAAVFVGNVEVQGNLHVTGAIQNPAPPPAGASATAAGAGLEAVEEFGEATLLGGRAEVRLDPAFAAALQDGRYQVFLTEYDDHSALYVARRTAQGFEVRAKDSPTAGGAFAYRMVGRRRAAAAGERRAEAATVFQPSIPQTQGAPTLPAHGADSVPTPANAPRPGGR